MLTLQRAAILPRDTCYATLCRLITLRQRYFFIADIAYSRRLLFHAMIMLREARYAAR